MTEKTAEPWDNEPDGLDWVDEVTGLSCKIVRSPHIGHLCGYVAVGTGHPLYGEIYGKVDMNVHGGLTNSHMGANDEWWFGFDCAHAGDRTPRGLQDPDGTYRTIGFVARECERLAEQLSEVTNLPARGGYQDRQSGGKGMTEHPATREIWTYYGRDGYDMEWSTFPPEGVVPWGDNAEPVRYVRADIADDMLAALKLALEKAIECDPDYMDTYIIRTEVRDVCRAAIAKAEGESCT